MATPILRRASTRISLGARAPTTTFEMEDHIAASHPMQQCASTRSALEDAGCCPANKLHCLVDMRNTIFSAFMEATS
jgi:hypothetical protein